MLETRGQRRRRRLRRSLVLLALVAAFAAGFYFDRWLHRRIVIYMVPRPAATALRVDVDERCFSDRAEACPTLPPKVPHCWFRFDGNNYCQADT